MSSASAPRDDAAIPPSVATPREEEEGRSDVISRRTKRMTYSRELLLAVGSLEACKLLPADADLAKHPDDAALWVPSQTLAARSAGGAPGGLGDQELPRRNRGERAEGSTVLSY
ncbi:hypothetical protein CFC21_083068 [Triticum aestivum]|uniref:Uncharacterized protein n=2 Tax=Triticum aestivum TaxID=4565 RepID=A0A3B6NPG4_WHEAT|nr:hypothetical protein CFC21_083068 [Triticum aestivum]